MDNDNLRRIFRYHRKELVCTALKIEHLAIFNLMGDHEVQFRETVDVRVGSGATL